MIATRSYKKSESRPSVLWIFCVFSASLALTPLLLQNSYSWRKAGSPAAREDQWFYRNVAYFNQSWGISTRGGGERQTNKKLKESDETKSCFECVTSLWHHLHSLQGTCKNELILLQLLIVAEAQRVVAGLLQGNVVRTFLLNKRLTSAGHSVNMKT